MHPPPSSNARARHHLLIDGRCLRARPTGVGIALWRLLLGLEGLLREGKAEGWRVTVLRLAGEMASPAFRRRWEGITHLQIEGITADPESHPAGDLWLAARLPRLARSLGADVLYSPAFLSPPRACGVARLVMVHDDLLWSQPASYPPAFRYYLRAGTRLATRRADAVLFPSRDAARRAGARLRIPKNRRAVLPHAVDPKVHFPAPLEGREPTILCIANAERRKNHEVLLRALGDPVELPGGGPELILAGFPESARDRLAELRRTPCAVSWHTTHLPEDRELADALRRAGVLVLPSRGEGFGLPVLEAMACGTPLVLSDLPVLREVAGEAAAYVAPEDAEGWRSEMLRALEAGPEVRRRVAIGLERARRATPERLARRFLRLCERVV